MQKPNRTLLNLFKLIGSIIESLFLLFNKFDCVIISSRSFLAILKYYLISKFNGMKLFITIVEDPDVMPGARTFRGKINNTLFNKFAWKLVDGAFPISDFLIKKINECNDKVPILKVPALVDLAIFDKVVKNPEEKYYLFCGAASYFDIIKFIIDSYNLLSNTEYKLFLVINGDGKAIRKIDNEIEQSAKKDLIKRFDYLPYSELVSLYKNAAALLIPLRPINRDIARFPHKIGEYCASRNPIISTNFGEIKHYFTHRDNALIAKNYDIKKYADQLEYVIKHPLQSRQIGENGRLLCEKEFDYKIFGKKIMDFLNE